MKNVKMLTMIYFVITCMVFISCDNNNNKPDDPWYDDDNTNTTEKPKPPTGTENGYSWVDLGLSVKWATCNIGAWKPEGYGNYYAWGETSTKSEYTEDNYTYKSQNPTLSLIRDAAFANWGGTWRMPTYYELYELATLCSWNWTTLNGVNGYEVKSKTNNNSIFLPAAGSYIHNDIINVGEKGKYRSSELNSNGSEFSPCIYFSEMEIKYNSGYLRYIGNSIRAVCP